MSEERPPKTIRVEFSGQVPSLSREWCATCAIRFMGAFSSHPAIREHARELVEAGLENGAAFVTLALPKEVKLDGYPSFILRYAVTTAPSVYFPEIAMPVCWTHIQGMHPEGREERAVNVPTSLIQGKKYEVPKGALPDE